MDFTQYWFMLPIGTLVATTAMLSGIGGAALFTPIFVVIFPMLGPQYPLESTVAAIGSALLTETFGFSSGFIGYYRKGLIDFSIVRKFLIVSVPVAIIGALVAQFFEDSFLMFGYALLVFILALILIFFHHDHQTSDTNIHSDKRKIVKVDNAGNAYEYHSPDLNFMSGIITSLGAFLTGLLSVGIGEVVVPQLTKRGIPVAVAAATSVAVVIVTVAAASFTLIGQLIRAGGMSAVPWNLVIYTIPGVIIGGQIGPRLQGLVSQRFMERSIGILFIVIAIAMVFVAIR